MRLRVYVSDENRYDFSQHAHTSSGRAIRLSIVDDSNRPRRAKCAEQHQLK